MMEQGGIWGEDRKRADTAFITVLLLAMMRAETPVLRLRAPSADSHFRQDVENSDKTYGFIMEGRSNRVYEFEAHHRRMSHATLCKLNGIDWRKDHRVSEGCLSDKALALFI